MYSPITSSLRLTNKAIACPIGLFTFAVRRYCVKTPAAASLTDSDAVGEDSLLEELDDYVQTTAAGVVAEETSTPEATPPAPPQENFTVKVYGPEGRMQVTPLEDFNDLRGKVPGWLHKNLLNEGFKRPTAVQQYAVPVTLEKGSLVALAPTGTGKTVGFAVPLLTSLGFKKGETFPQSVRRCAEAKRIMCYPKVLILCPARELVRQTASVMLRLAKGSHVKVRMAFGGVPVDDQLRALRTGCDLLVATPGRLKQFMDENCLSLKDTHYIVLDEADRMLEMGFEHVINMVFEAAPTSQVMLWTATWPKGAKEIADRYLPSETIRIKVLSDSTVHQHTHVMQTDEDKFQFILGLFEKGDIPKDKKVLVFANRKIMVEELFERLGSALDERGFITRSLHGDLNQRQRDTSMDLFRNGRCKLLIASDVAARGIDVPVDYVINFDLPDDIDKYQHRIGRTGRAGKTGIAYTLVSSNTKGHVLLEFIDKLRSMKAEVPQELQDLAEMNLGIGGKSFGKFKGEELKNRVGLPLNYTGSRKRSSSSSSESNATYDWIRSSGGNRETLSTKGKFIKPEVADNQSLGQREKEFALPITPAPAVPQKKEETFVHLGRTSNKPPARPNRTVAAPISATKNLPKFNV